MFDLNEIVRPNIAALVPYSSARSEFQGDADIYLDANENPFGELNRYPDPMQKELKQKIAKIKGVSDENIFIGNGSDEIIDLCFRIFCEPTKDAALTFVPTYGMYQVSAAINNVKFLKVNLNADFQINTTELDLQLSPPNLKLVFICSPNNPTGNTIDAVEYIVQNFSGIVVVDEAYIDFTSAPSMLHHIERYPNLIVLQTMSKAYGLAAARIGIGFADSGIIALFNKVKPPYNVSLLNQNAAIAALENIEDLQSQCKMLIKEREKLAVALSELKLVKRVLASEANFLLVEFINNEVFAKLLADKIIVRNRHSILQNHMRITIGTPDENLTLLKAIKNIQ